MFNIAYLTRIAKVTHMSQVFISSLALIAYVYVIGGVFAAVEQSRATPSTPYQAHGADCTALRPDRNRLAADVL
jgi:hypothetical protein